MTDLRDEPALVVEPRPARRRWPALAAVAVVVAGVGFVLFWFQPQKLFIDDRVEEPIPVATPTNPPPTSAPAADAPAPPPSVAPSPAPTEPTEVARGEFLSLDHGTTGVARVLELADGTRIVRVEGLDTSNGPDLYLYVTATPAGGEETAFDDEYVNLGRLKGNQGDHNYDLPPDTDLARFATVLIWCDRFDSAFGAADLTTA